MVESYSRVKLLGEGSFGKCYLMRCASDQSLCVIKKISLKTLSRNEREEALREAKILEKFKHPNIIRFKEVYRTTRGDLCIVMDYADGGDLQGKIAQQQGRFFNENQILDWFVQICLAIKHVHDRKVLHRDLKTQNVFLTRNGRIKLGDFGIARVLKSTIDKAVTMVGTPYYISPEIIENKPYSFKSDVWSLGVMLYEMCALRPPFDASSLHYLAVKIVRGVYSPLPTQYSTELRGLVTQLLSVNAEERPTVNQILKMPFIKARISSFLSETIKHSEFSHTILHNHDFLNPEPQREEPKLPPQTFPATPLPQEVIIENTVQVPRHGKAIEPKAPVTFFVPVEPVKSAKPSKTKQAEPQPSKAAPHYSKAEAKAKREEERIQMLADIREKRNILRASAEIVEPNAVEEQEMVMEMQEVVLQADQDPVEEVQPYEASTDLGNDREDEDSALHPEEPQSRAEEYSNDEVCSTAYTENTQQKTFGYNKIEELRMYLEGVLRDCYFEIYEIVKQIYTEDPMCGYEAYYPALKHLMDSGDQEELLPVICTLLYLESCLEQGTPIVN
jgi:NIMA (never in mitosis gene a)-related kinase